MTSKQTISTLAGSALPAVNIKTFNIKAKEDETLTKILARKKKYSRSGSRRVMTEAMEETYVMKRRNSTNPFLSMEETVMKPTDKYFYQLKNIRLA